MTMRGRLWRSVPSWWLIPTLLVGGCSVPDSMGVRSGADPRHQDDNVRFRSTYYFRVFDVCRDSAGKAVSRGAPRLDSLYRFRMTGKASALFSKVRFESGVLRKSEIDPFGATVVLDEKLGRPSFVSREETDRAARRNERHDEIERLIELLKKLDKLADEEAVEVGGTTMTDAVQGVITKLQTAMEQQVQNLVEPVPGRQDDSEDTPAVQPSPGQLCPAGTELRRGFQLMGPEGIATFNQDQRLIMAMTSSGKPLLSALKELSGRMLAEHGSPGDVVLPLVREDLATLRAERALDRLEDDSAVSVEQMIDQIIDAFQSGHKARGTVVMRFHAVFVTTCLAGTAALGGYADIPFTDDTFTLSNAASMRVEVEVYKGPLSKTLAVQWGELEGLVDTAVA